MQNKKNLLIGIIAVSLGFSGCSKKLDQNNPSYFTLDTYFKTSNELLLGTNAIYSSLHSGQVAAREWFYVHDCRSDDVASGGGQLEVPRAQILNGTMANDNSVITSLWDGLYAIIHRSNSVIASAPNITDNASLISRCVGEAKFLRAWAYYELVSQWGAVPFYTQPVLNATSSSYSARKSTDTIYNQIVSDLKDASSTLPATYSADDLGRATSGAANALLGRVYMQTGDYASAKAVLLNVVNSGLYSLVSNYEDNFKEETEFAAESIFEIVFFDKGDNGFSWGMTGNGVSEAQTTLRNQEYCAVGWRNLIPSNHFLAEFENTATGAQKTDPRFGFSVYQSGDTYDNGAAILTDNDQNGNSSILNGKTVKISWKKYTLMYKEDKATASYHPGGDNQRVLRYAEVLINLAECEAELGNNTQAVAYLNQVRDRPSVNMPHYPTSQYPTSSKAQIISAIMHEKTVEMGCEEVRNLDIIRWRKKGYFTSGDPLPYFRANRDELLPIPQNEINNNPNLGNDGIPQQNPGF